MGLVKGIDAMLKINDEGSPVIIGCARSITFDIQRELIETSGAGTGVFRTYKPAAIGFSGTIEGLVNITPSGDPVGINKLYDYLIDGTVLSCTFYEVDIATPQNYLEKQCDMFLTSLTEVASFDNIATFTATFTGTGAITITSDEV
jgi:hypothetical protein